MSIDKWIRSFEIDLSMLSFIDTTTFIYENVLSRKEADCIKQAGEYAFEGRFGEAESLRNLGGYGGLGVLDRGALSPEAEKVREAFLRAFDNLDDDQ